MHRSVPKLVHDQNWIFKPFNIKLSLPHGIIKTYVIILETSISVNKPILGSGTCSLSMISTHTPIVTKPWNRYIMIRDIPKGNYFSTNLANNICYPDVRLSCTGCYLKACTTCFYIYLKSAHLICTIACFYQTLLFLSSFIQWLIYTKLNCTRAQMYQTCFYITSLIPNKIIGFINCHKLFLFIMGGGRLS